MVETGRVLQTFKTLMGEASEVGESFLLAAVYARALRTNESPRDVVDALFMVMPDSEAWPSFRDALADLLTE